MSEWISVKDSAAKRYADLLEWRIDMTNAEIVENARRTLYGHDPNEPFSCVEIGQISAVLGVARIVLRAKRDAEQQGPYSRCGYDGKHLEAPPCTICPTQPKETENNAPLTLDELREMTSRYVYWDARSERGGECRVADGYVVTPENDTYSFAWVLTHGNVYRRKPGEGNR